MERYCTHMRGVLDHAERHGSLGWLIENVCGHAKSCGKGLDSKLCYTDTPDNVNIMSTWETRKCSQGERKSPTLKSMSARSYLVPYSWLQ